MPLTDRKIVMVSIEGFDRAMKDIRKMGNFDLPKQCSRKEYLERARYILLQVIEVADNNLYHKQHTEAFKRGTRLFPHIPSIVICSMRKNEQRVIQRFLAPLAAL